MQKQNNLPLVSIIVPVYNVAKYLNKCLESIKKQTYKNIEVIIVCDGLDKDMSICQAFVKKDNRFKLIKNIKKGLGGARNAGIKAAQGDYILFVDADDYIDSKCVSLLIKSAIEQKNDVIIAQTHIFPDEPKNIHCIQETKKIINWFGTPAIKSTQVLENDIEEIYSKINCTAWNKLFSTSFLLKNKIFFIDENCFHEDHGFWLKVLSSSPTISSIEQTTYYYRVKNKQNVYDIHSMRKSLTDALVFVKDRKQYSAHNFIKTEIYKTFSHPIWKIINLKNEYSFRFLSIPIFKMKRYPSKNKQIIKIFGIQIWKRSCQ